MRFIVSRDYSPYGRVFLISKLKVGVGVAVLILATAAITATVVSKWNPFSPQDYEDCAARAARDAKSKDALSVLLSICSSEFKARRKIGGGYTYYDSCQDRTFNIKGPNPTADEQKYIREECSAYLDARARVTAEEEESERKAKQAAQEARDRQIAQEARDRQIAQEAMARQEQEARAEESRRLQEIKNRQQNALRSVKISETKVECYESQGGVCYLNFAVTNGSRETVSGISLGWMFPSVWDVSCPSELSTKEKEDKELRPGETARVLIVAADSPPYTGNSPKVCIKVTSVDIVP